jgi:hypothetical protein
MYVPPFKRAVLRVRDAVTGGVKSVFVRRAG